MAPCSVFSKNRPSWTSWYLSSRLYPTVLSVFNLYQERVDIVDNMINNTGQGVNVRGIEVEERDQIWR